MMTEVVLRFVGKETYGKAGLPCFALFSAENRAGVARNGRSVAVLGAQVRLWGGVGFGFGSLITGLLSHVTPLGYSVVFLESLFVNVASASAVFGLAYTARERLLDANESPKCLGAMSF